MIGEGGARVFKSAEGNVFEFEPAIKADIVFYQFIASCRMVNPNLLNDACNHMVSSMLHIYESEEGREMWRSDLNLCIQSDSVGEF